jgi:hypothetical protein
MIHDIEQASAIAFIEIETVFSRPGTERGAVAAALGLIGVGIAHRLDATDDMRGTDRFPIFPGRIIPQANPSLLSILDGRRFRLTSMGWPGQLISFGRFNRAKMMVSDIANDTVVEPNFRNFVAGLQDDAMPIGISDVKTLP